MLTSQCILRTSCMSAARLEVGAPFVIREGCGGVDAPAQAASASVTVGSGSRRSSWFVEGDISLAQTAVCSGRWPDAAAARLERSVSRRELARGGRCQVVSIGVSGTRPAPSTSPNVVGNVLRRAGCRAVEDLRSGGLTLCAVAAAQRLGGAIDDVAEEVD